MNREQAIKHYTSLKKDVEEISQKAARAEGALEQTLQELKEKYGCGTIEAAEKLLQKLSEKEKKQMDDFEKELHNFESEWDELINESE